MKILRLISAEVKRLMLKPGIFVLTAVFVLSVGFANIIYDPEEREMDTIDISGADVSAIYTTFQNQNLNVYNGAVTDLQDYLDFCISFEKKNVDDEGNTIDANPFDVAVVTKDDLITLKTTADTTYNLYKNAINLNAGLLELNTKKTNLRTALENLYDDYIAAGNATNKAFFVKTAATDPFEANMNRFIALIPEADQTEEQHQTIAENLRDSKFISVIDTFLDDLYEPVLEQEFTADLTTDYLTETNTRLSALTSDMDTFVLDNGTSATDEDKAKINAMFSKYKATINQAESIINNSLSLSMLNEFTNAEINEFEDYAEYNVYDTKEDLLLNKAMYDNEDFYYNYSSALNIFTTSNEKINAFDFTVYALEYLGFIIILYLITISAGSIVGEEASGTLKMLAVRPIKRSKIFNGKMITNIVLAALLVAVGTAAAFAAGTVLFGINTTTIVTIFNASTVITMAPYEMLILYAASLFIKVVFYIILAMFVAMITRSSIIGSSLTYLAYFSTFILGGYAIGSSALIYKILPMSGTGLFKYISPNFASTLEAVVINDFGLYAALISLVLYSGAMWILSLTIFKRRDLK